MSHNQYKAYLLDSKRYKGKVLKLESPGFFKGTVLRPGSKPQMRHSEIIVGHLVPVSGGHPTDKPVMNGEHEAMNLLCELIEEAQRHGEAVTVTVRSPRGWTGPNYKIKRRYRQRNE